MIKKFGIAFIFCTLVLCFKAQDTIRIRNGKPIPCRILIIERTKIIFQLPGRRRPDGIHLSSVEKIVYQDGSETLFNFPRPERAHYREMIHEFKSPYIKKNFIRLYFTDIFVDKISLGYERLLNQNYSLEVDAHYRFSIGRQDPVIHTKPSLRYYHPLSNGYEVKVGVSRHHHLRRNRASLGFALSYGEQGFSSLNFNEDPSIKTGYYSLTHKRRSVGTFLKLNYQFTPQESGLEFFISPGFYSAFTHNTYHSYTSSGYPRFYTTDPDQIPKFTAKYMKEGFALFPYVNLGISYIVKQPQKGWYPKLERRRDSLRIHGKNTLLFNSTELIENAIGFTYLRMSYKHSLSYYTSASIGLNNGLGPGISNSMLQERNTNYVFTDKNFDVLLGMNFNLSRRQASFPFLGVSCRMAQFEGYSYDKKFLLNRYYFHLNTGYMLRSDKGVSFLFNLGPGHYFNRYLSPDPHFHPPFSGLNAFYVSVQLGYSF